MNTPNTQYVSDKKCRRGHNVFYKTSGRCVECRNSSNGRWLVDNRETARTSSSQWYWRNVEAVAAAHARWRALNSEVKTASDARWAAANPEARNAISARWRARNPEKARNVQTRWRARNPAKVAAAASRRRAAILKATPSWLNVRQHLEMNYMYEKAAKLREKTGDMYHVDHVVPLRGKNVCGLHVPWNLQLLEDADNWRKGNRRA